MRLDHTRWRPGIEVRSASTSPLGAIKLHGFLPMSSGMLQRRLGRHALVFSLRGTCDYWDELNGRRTLGAGDAFLLFPEVAHRYGGSGPDGWDEIFIVFEGPVFDLWRAQGLLDPKAPFLKLLPVPLWRRRIEACILPDTGPESALRQVVALQELLAEALATRSGAPGARPEWLDRASVALSSPGALRIRLDALAGELGVSFETFRKSFTRAMGTSPAQYRSARIVDAAARLLSESGASGKEIATALGFSDEYHFSRRFKKLTGMTPTEFRRRDR